MCSFYVRDELSPVWFFFFFWEFVLTVTVYVTVWQILCSNLQHLNTGQILEPLWSWIISFKISQYRCHGSVTYDKLSLWVPGQKSSNWWKRSGHLLTLQSKAVSGLCNRCMEQFGCQENLFPLCGLPEQVNRCSLWQLCLSGVLTGQPDWPCVVASLMCEQGTLLASWHLCSPERQKATEAADTFKYRALCYKWCTKLWCQLLHSGIFCVSEVENVSWLHFQNLLKFFSYSLSCGWGGKGNSGCTEHWWTKSTWHRI